MAILENILDKEELARQMQNLAKTQGAAVADDIMKITDAEVFDIVEGGQSVDLFAEAVEEGQDAGKGLQELSRPVATEGLTPLPGEFIPSKAGLSVDDKAFNKMQEDLGNVGPFAGDLPSAGPTRQEVKAEHGIYEGRPIHTDNGMEPVTYTTKRDLQEESIQRHQASQQAQGVGKTDMEVYKESFKKNFAKDGLDVDTWGLTNEDYASLKDWDDRKEDLLRRDAALYKNRGSMSYADAYTKSKGHRKEMNDLKKEISNTEWGIKMLKGTGRYETWGQ